MCGIIGAIAQRNVVPILIEGLRRLEYRGYDSAGIAVIDTRQMLKRIRTAGKVNNLAHLLKQTPFYGQVGIAHTRWATHGPPNEANAHPHTACDSIALVHNGIIENFAQLKTELTAFGYTFTSQTDSEVAVHKVHQQTHHTSNLLNAVQQAVPSLIGAYAFGIISRHEPSRLIATRRGSPLVIGVGVNEHFIASDSLALAPVTRQIIYLDDGDIADITPTTLSIYNSKGESVNRPIQTNDLPRHVSDKGAFKHYMLKEIHEQPDALANSLAERIQQTSINPAAFGINAAPIFERTKEVQIIACGTSYHAGLVARYWFENLTGMRCLVDFASEFRYRNPVITPETLIVTISQSGETADTLAALQEAKKHSPAGTLTICNVDHSSLIRLSDLILMTQAGPEIGVASTKAFTTQLAMLLLLVIVLGRRHRLTAEMEADFVKQLHGLPDKIAQALTLDNEIKNLARHFTDKQHALFLGRGAHYPIALEGALKLKEISYIHAEAYPAGELKHGPLALVDHNMPVIAVAPNDQLLEKLKSNLEEVRSRDGQLIVFCDPRSDVPLDKHTILLPITSVENIIAPIVFTIPLQLLAYHVAIIKGTDVDQPRNLAKSVTVE